MTLPRRHPAAPRWPSARRALAAALLLLAGTDAAVAATACPEPQDHANSEQRRYGVDPRTPLRARVAPPSAEAIEAYVRSGVAQVRAHRPTPAQWARLDAALAQLPALHRQLLHRHLRHFSFVDVPPGAGNGLTAVVSDGDFPVFDLTLRAGILDETLADFLTEKERTVFADDGSGMTVSIEAPGSAIDYVLLHETTHVVDRTLGLTNEFDSLFTAGVWLDRTRLDAPWSTMAIASHPYRRGPTAPVSSAADLYRSLSASPFVSLYATAAAPEDFAELVTWQHLVSRNAQPLEIIIRDASGAPTYRLHPLRQPKVAERMEAAKALLAKCKTGREEQRNAALGDS